MVKKLLGNIKGPEGPKGPPGPPGADGTDGIQGPKGESGILETIDIKNMFEELITFDESNVRLYNTELMARDGVTVVSSLGGDLHSYIQFYKEVTLKKDKYYMLSFDFESPSISQMDNIWLITTDGSGNYSIHPHNRYTETNIYNLETGTPTRGYIYFKPERDMTGNIRVGSSISGDFEYSKISLSQSNVISYPNPSAPLIDHTEFRLYKNEIGAGTGPEELSIWSPTDRTHIIDGVLTLPPGIWMINWAFEFHNPGEGYIQANIRQDGTAVHQSRYYTDENMNITTVINVNQQASVISFTVENTSDVPASMSATTRNRTTVTKLK